MKYFKKEENGIVIRIDECEINPCGGEEISRDEYQALFNKPDNDEKEPINWE